MESSSDTETEWDSDTETEWEWDSDTELEPKTTSIQKKLIMKHKYVITIDGTNQT